MAIRVQNNGALSFGTVADANIVITHVRIQKAGVNAIVGELANNITANIGVTLSVASGDLDVVYPSGDLTNAHMNAVITPYWSGETFQVDLMTSATAAVSDSGYSQQTHNAWTITQENDP